MLAYKVDSKPVDWTKKVYMQPKLDGVRCVIQLNDKGEVYAYSRTGKPWLNINHILENLKPFFDTYEDAILDGELYNHDLRDDFEKIISLVRKQKPTADDRAESKELVQFHCYDYAHTDEDYSKRLYNLTCEDFYSYCIKLVHTTQVKSQSHADILHALNLDTDYEGSMDYELSGDDGEMANGTIHYKAIDGKVDPNSLKGEYTYDGNHKIDDDTADEMIKPGGAEHEEALKAAQEDYDFESDRMKSKFDMEDKEQHKGCGPDCADHGCDCEYGRAGKETKDKE